MKEKSSWRVHTWISSITVRDGSKMVCRCICNEQGMKYARFIAKAPEMCQWQHKALELLRSIPSMSGVPYRLIGEIDSLVEEGDNILAKARGEK